MDRTVLVTGGARRLGKVIADRLRHNGWKVIVSSHRDDVGADIVADLSVPSGAAKLYAAAIHLLGGDVPDAIVNNAALFTGDEASLECVNSLSPQKLTMLMAGREKTGRGAVVNIIDACPHEDPYGRTKRELREYTFKSAAMFADTLRVNAVSPGPVMVPENVHEKAADTLIGRPSPEDVADAVEFLLLNESITGVDLPVDCGARLLQ